MNALSPLCPTVLVIAGQSLFTNARTAYRWLPTTTPV